MYPPRGQRAGDGKSPPVQAAAALQSGGSLNTLMLGPVGRRRFTLPEIAWHLHRACRRNILRYGRPGASLRPKYLSFIASAEPLEWLDIELIYARYQAEQGKQIAWSLRIVVPDEWRALAQRQPAHIPPELDEALPLATYDGALLSYCSDGDALAEVAVTTENYFGDGDWLDLLWATLQAGQPSEMVVALETGAFDEADLLAPGPQAPQAHAAEEVPFAVARKPSPRIPLETPRPLSVAERHPQGAEPMGDDARAFAQDAWLRHTGKTENLPDQRQR